MPRVSKPLILIIEDEKDLSSLIATELEESQMDTQICNTGEHAERFLEDNFVNLILLDINLPDKSGFQILQGLRGNDNYTPVIFFRILHIVPPHNIYYKRPFLVLIG